MRPPESLRENADTTTGQLNRVSCYSDDNKSVQDANNDVRWRGITYCTLSQAEHPIQVILFACDHWVTTLCSMPH